MINKLSKQDNILKNIRLLINAARESVNRQVDSTMTLTYFLVGRYIVEDEQEGEERAKYSKSVLKYLSENLTTEFGKGFSVDNLENMRKFFISYKNNPYAIEILNFISISEKESRKLLHTTDVKPVNTIYENLTRKLILENEFIITNSEKQSRILDIYYDENIDIRLILQNCSAKSFME